MTLTISGVQIGGDAPCRFVAELSNNHNGSLDRALCLIDAAKAAGADFVKLQCYTPDELVQLRGDGPAPEPWGSQGWTMRRLYEKAQTPHAWFPALVEHCGKVGIPWFSSVFGGESLNLLESLGCPAYKIARLDVNDEGLWMSAFATGKPLLMSFGERDYLNFNAAVRLWCPEGYPQTHFALHPGMFGEAECSDCGAFDAADFQGLSYHGTDPRPCIVAATLGAKLIEAHFQLDHAFADRTPACATHRGFSCDCDNLSKLEANVSLTASQFKRMIDDVRATEAMLG